MMLTAGDVLNSMIGVCFASLLWFCVAVNVSLDVIDLISSWQKAFADSDSDAMSMFADLC